MWRGQHATKSRSGSQEESRQVEGPARRKGQKEVTTPSSSVCSCALILLKSQTTGIVTGRFCQKKKINLGPRCWGLQHHWLKKKYSGLNLLTFLRTERRWVFSEIEWGPISTTMCMLAKVDLKSSQKYGKLPLGCHDYKLRRQLI